MPTKIQFTRTSDGVRIAYTRASNGGPPLLVNRAMRMGLEIDLAVDPCLQTLAAATTMTLFDHGGSGASQRDVIDLSLDAQVRELEAVAACIEEPTFTLAAAQAGCVAAAAYAATHPDRVERLICFNGAPSSLEEWPLGFLRENWSVARRYVAAAAYPEGPVEAQRRYSQAIAESAAHEVYTRWYEEYRAVDPERIFAGVTVPTLMIQRVKTVADRARLDPLAGAVGDCHVVILDGRPGIGGGREEALVCLEFMGLSAPAEAKSRPSAETAIIMFTDIVDSTALTERLGDSAFRERARDLDQALRQIIKAADGLAIDGKLLGDGVLATFPSAAQAIGAARHASAAGRSGGLPLHLGLHAGDVIREDGNVFGGAVNIAARISALSAPNEILVSDIVRGLARTSAGVAFDDRGEHALKGIEDPVRLYAVSPRTA